MRDPKRIREILENIEEFWQEVPDWRFGQLMLNFLGWAAGKTRIDPFFIEDEKLKELLKEYRDTII